MKNMISKTILCILFAGATLVASATSSENNFADYQIIPVKMANETTVHKWNLVYNAQEAPLTIEAKETKAGKRFIVRSPYFEVAYSITKKGFGAEYVRNSESQVPYELTSCVLCAEAMKNQSVLSPNQVTDEQALGLIANYLPDLVNKTYKHLLN